MELLSFALVGATEVEQKKKEKIALKMQCMPHALRFKKELFLVVALHYLRAIAVVSKKI